MTTIFKYPIEIVDKQLILFPVGCKILHAGLDPHGLPCVWAVVNTEANLAPKTVHVVGTGFRLPPNASNHAGSFTQGPYVWHVFVD